VERELDDRDAVERAVVDRLAVERVLPLAREPVDERPVLLDLEAPVLRRLEPPLELEPDPPLLACGICSSLKDESRRIRVHPTSFCSHDADSPIRLAE
jgi:hypothetical protein